MSCLIWGSFGKGINQNIVQVNNDKFAYIVSENLVNWALEHHGGTIEPVWHGPVLIELRNNA